jgi:hypothetical protein
MARGDLQKRSRPGEHWGQLGEVANNTTWPNEGEHPALRGNGGGGVVKKVAETPRTIGYANVADARANKAFVPPEGGSEKAIFWAEVENHPRCSVAAPPGLTRGCAAGFHLRAVDGGEAR